MVSWQDSQRIAQNQYAEDMYNMYQSPAAHVHQYSDAGLNPRLAINSSSVGRVSASLGSSGGAPSGTHVNPMGYSPLYMDTKGFASSFGEIANALKSLSEAKKNGIDTEYLEDEWKQKLKSYKLSNAAQELLNSVNIKYLDKKEQAILDKFAVDIANGKITGSNLMEQLELLKKENII